tara:strand:+ start:633 stop:1154 length:522 start_codon:yes stop_codon:yes gene_type:complete
MFRLTIEKALNHIINVNSINISHLDNSLISLCVDDIGLQLFFFCINDRIFIIENSEKKDSNVDIKLNKKAFLSLFEGASFEDLIENEEIKINGSIKTAKQLADLFASSSLDMEELISQYTGDVMAYQIGQTIEKIKDSKNRNKGSFVEALQDELTTLLIAPSRSKFFKKEQFR